MSRVATVRRARGFAGTVEVPGDKSISHRALILAALGEGPCRIAGLAPGEDVRRTAACLEALGVRLHSEGAATVVEGVGLEGLSSPREILHCGNSGTTMRLLAGVIAGARIAATLDGDASLRRRPMRRVLSPLAAMGAGVEGRALGEEVFAPLVFRERRGPLRGREHHLEVASAQVKSAILLAGLGAHGATRVCEPTRSRDHSERMLRAFGASIEGEGTCVALHPQGEPLRPPPSLRIPGDPSSAAFLAVAALLVPGGSIEVEGVSLNETRIGWLRALRRMGAAIEVEELGEEAGDPVGRIRARHQPKALRAIEIRGAEIPSMIDELPLLAVVATQARGRTTIRGAGELRLKESDRIHRMAEGLGRMGARVEERGDGWVIEGGEPLAGARVEVGEDHRIAMSLAVAGLVAAGETRIEGAQWVDVSFPGFFEVLGGLTRGE